MRVGFGVGAWNREVVGVAVGVEDVEGHVGPGDLAASVTGNKTAHSEKSISDSYSPKVKNDGLTFGNSSSACC